jgi:ParB family chromosome partitioning protein
MSKSTHKQFGASILARVNKMQDDEASNPSQEANPAARVLDNRETALSKIATGKRNPDGTMLVDPARCRPWKFHNRDDKWLSQENCQDLIDSMLAMGKQNIPAIVRRVKDDPNYDYEVIAGRRRHWVVSWLRENDHENFEFLISVQSLSDSEAFRVADVENRNRKDLTCIERARDWLTGLNEFYGGNQRTMATRHGISPGTLSKYIQLAQMDPELLSAYPNVFEIGIHHSSKILPLWKDEQLRPFIRLEAQRIKSENAKAKEEGREPLNATQVTTRLQLATKQRPKSELPEPKVLLSQAGKTMMIVTAAMNGDMTLKVHARSGATRGELMSAFAEAIADLAE